MVAAERVRTRVQEICDQPRSSTIYKLKAILGLVGAQFARLTPGTLEDIYRKAPQIWRTIEENRSRIIHHQVEAMIQAAIREGAIRKYIDPKLTVVILLMIVKHVLNPEKLFVLSASAKEVFESVVKITYQGLLAESARKSFSVEDTAAAVMGGREG